nr:probable leucine-rich repeat receptor-like protein kinase At5g49770 [Tanacetum cinerariifolium]
MISGCILHLHSGPQILALCSRKLLKILKMFLCSRTLEALLTSLSELYLSYNKLSGALHDLSGKSSLTCVDLSNNSFQESDPPPWFFTLTILSTLVMEFGTLKWKLPQTLFDLNDMLSVYLFVSLINLFNLLEGIHTCENEFPKEADPIETFG